MNHNLIFNKRTLIEKEFALAQNKLELERLILDRKEYKKLVKNKELRMIVRNRITIKRLEIENMLFDIKYNKETYLS